jgi:hypothetical protein
MKAPQLAEVAITLSLDLLVETAKLSCLSSIWRLMSKKRIVTKCSVFKKLTSKRRPRDARFFQAQATSKMSSCKTEKQITVNDKQIKLDNYVPNIKTDNRI